MSMSTHARHYMRKKLSTWDAEGYFNWVPDPLYLRIKYRLELYKKLNLSNPITFNEKMQWLKLYDRNPQYTMMVDKLAVRDYVSNLIGGQHLFPLLGHWENVDQIDFDQLPNQFVLKCTHDSGGSVICKDKSELDIGAAKAKLLRHLRNNFYYEKREWPYKNVKPRLLAEKFMVDESGVELKDYKFFCFDGEPKALFVASDRGAGTKFDFYDMEFNHLPFCNGHPNATKTITKPAGFEHMKALAATLSQGIPHVRVDLYDINGAIYFGEFTFTHWSGFVPFNPEEWDYTFGSWLTLPAKKKRF
jgi:hypothetical protein